MAGVRGTVAAGLAGPAAVGLVPDDRHRRRGRRRGQLDAVRDAGRHPRRQPVCLFAGQRAVHHRRAGAGDAHVQPRGRQRAHRHRLGHRQPGHRHLRRREQRPGRRGPGIELAGRPEHRHGHHRLPGAGLRRPRAQPVLHGPVAARQRLRLRVLRRDVVRLRGDRADLHPDDDVRAAQYVRGAHGLRQRRDDVGLRFRFRSDRDSDRAGRGVPDLPVRTQREPAAPRHHVLGEQRAVRRLPERGQPGKHHPGTRQSGDECHHGAGPVQLRLPVRLLLRELQLHRRASRRLRLPAHPRPDHGPLRGGSERRLRGHRGTAVRPDFDLGADRAQAGRLLVAERHRDARDNPDRPRLRPERVQCGRRDQPGSDRRGRPVLHPGQRLRGLPGTLGGVQPHLAGSVRGQRIGGEHEPEPVPVILLRPRPVVGGQRRAGRRLVPRLHRPVLRAADPLRGAVHGRRDRLGAHLRRGGLGLLDDGLAQHHRRVGDDAGRLRLVRRGREPAVHLGGHV